MKLYPYVNISGEHLIYFTERTYINKHINIFSKTYARKLSNFCLNFYRQNRLALMLCEESRLIALLIKLLLMFTIMSLISTAPLNILRAQHYINLQSLLCTVFLLTHPKYADLGLVDPAVFVYTSSALSERCVRNFSSRASHAAGFSSFVCFFVHAFVCCCA